MDPLKRRFGTVIRKRRLEAGLSQEALAHKARLHSTYISMLERGIRMPTLGVIDSLASALGTTMGSLITELDRTAD